MESLRALIGLRPLKGDQRMEPGRGGALGLPLRAVSGSTVVRWVRWHRREQAVLGTIESAMIALQSPVARHGAGTWPATGLTDPGPAVRSGRYDGPGALRQVESFLVF
jgi:hypothetical protein